MSDDEIYGYQHRLELVLTGLHGISESKDILEANKKVLLDYHTFLKTRRLSLPRQEKLMKALKRLGVVYPVPKKANLVALEGFGIRVAKKLYETGEAKKVYALYGAQYVPL